MAGLAALARALGYTVTGSDAQAYPPMSTQLAALGIDILDGYLPEHLEPAPDLVIIGNALSRGNPAVEAVLDRGLPYVSGAQWLAEQVLRDHWVIAVAGTHGKTTTSAMIAWILDYAGLEPGFVIGGMPGNFEVSSRLGSGPHIVVEADEYDTAFFDKRAKFVHYRPRTLVMNNLEFDHADIYPDLAAIQRQFHHLVRTVPGNGGIFTRAGDEALEAVLAQGCWTPVERLGGDDWGVTEVAADGSRFAVHRAGRPVGTVAWSIRGRFNVDNALAAIAAAAHAGVPPALCCEALAGFAGVKRRLELRGEAAGVRVYDDFAHHPTAIAATLEAARKLVAAGGRVIAVAEMRSNSMKQGVFQSRLAPAFAAADKALLYQPPQLSWSLQGIAEGLDGRGTVFTDLDTLTAAVCAQARADDVVIVMSNGGFGGVHQRLLTALSSPAVAV